MTSIAPLGSRNFVQPIIDIPISEINQVNAENVDKPQVKYAQNSTAQTFKYETLSLKEPSAREHIDKVSNAGVEKLNSKINSNEISLEIIKNTLKTKAIILELDEDSTATLVQASTRGKNEYYIVTKYTPKWDGKSEAFPDNITLLQKVELQSKADEKDQFIVTNVPPLKLVINDLIPKK
jgi:hypothetical protein